MLTTSELLQIYEKLNLSQQARQVIDSIRSSPPARRVRALPEM